MAVGVVFPLPVTIWLPARGEHRAADAPLALHRPNYFVHSLRKSTERNNDPAIHGEERVTGAGKIGSEGWCSGARHQRSAQAKQARYNIIIPLNRALEAHLCFRQNQRDNRVASHGIDKDRFAIYIVKYERLVPVGC